MIAYNDHSRCFKAMPYFYDFLGDLTRGDIPPEKLRHMTQCVVCQGEIDRLKSILERSGNEHSRRQNQRDTIIIKLLGLHLVYTGEPVNCSTTKLFIPSLADPTLRIRVATPITAHIDKCRVCLKDLQKLRDLKLSHEQLCRLGQLIAYKQQADESTCAQDHPFIDSAAAMAFHETNAELLKHLCTCPTCRKLLYQQREDICKDLPRNEQNQSEISCESISTSDIYNFCVPYGLDPMREDFIVKHEPIASHLRSCPTCLARIQDLHETVYGIVGRPDSGVVTCFKLQDDSDKTVETEAFGTLTDRLCNVQMPNRDNIKETTCGKVLSAADALKLKSRISTMNLKRLARPAIVAAAMITIIYALFSGSPSAQALDPTIVTAIKSADNVHIARFKPDEVKPLQEKWVSRSLGIILLKTDEQFSLFSIPDKKRMIKYSQDSETTVERLPNDYMDVLRKSINSTLGITPFDNISNFPPDSRLTKKVINEGIEEHDLIYSKPAGPYGIRFSMWQFFVDSQTSLPYEVHIYSRRGAEEQYKMESRFEIKYPDEKEIKAVIESVSF